ncbi:MAG: hypothetical protein JWO58_2937 [Chitinophagaceae bacterium]|nr:hypothetical protein [Chitinophagaceae bacterium]
MNFIAKATFFFLVLLTGLVLPSFSQQLQKRIRVTYENQTIEYILEDIHQNYQINFSYPSSILTAHKKTSLKTVNEPLQLILQRLFEGTSIFFEEKGNQIILKRKKVLPIKKNLPVNSSEIPKDETSINQTDRNNQTSIDTSHNNSSPSSNETTDLSIIKKIPINVSDTITSIQRQPSTTALVSSYKFTPKKSMALIHIAKGNYNTSQTALLLNVARKVKGNQWGIINIAHSVSGIQFGLLNICKKGYNKIEIWSSTTLEGNVAYKTGTKKFHSILAMGLSSDKDLDDYDWGLGYGFGTEILLTKSMALNIDALLYQLGYDLKEVPEEFNLMQQVKFNLGYQLTPKVCFFIGPECNIRFKPHAHSDHNQDADDHSSKTNAPVDRAKTLVNWGLHGGIRF